MSFSLFTKNKNETKLNFFVVTEIKNLFLKRLKGWNFRNVSNVYNSTRDTDNILLPPRRFQKENVTLQDCRCNSSEQKLISRLIPLEAVTEHRYTRDRSGSLIYGRHNR